jgi:signal transduction histidine kinase
VTARRAAALARRAVVETVYVIVSFPVAIVTFVLIVTAVSISLATAITLVGVPLFLVTVVAARVLADFERRRARVFLGARVARPYRPLTGSIVARAVGLVRDPASWRDMVYLVALMPLATVTFAAAVTIWSAALSLPLYPLWHSTFAEGGIVLNDDPLSSPLEVALTTAAGVVALVALPFVVHWVTRPHLLLVRSLLGRSRAEALRGRVEEVTRTRAIAVNAAAAERRRIERDLHDGAQQQMIAVAMALGRARERFERDPEGARELVAEAHQQAKSAIADLRNLARGIHPAVLTDRGLDAALSALAGRSAVPVAISVDLPRRPSAPIESIAYFVVAEGLANAAKHAGARHVAVDVRGNDGRVHVEVRDDGHGGAEVRPGGGLEGIAARVASVDGALRIASPPGGPTTIAAELPCG